MPAVSERQRRLFAAAYSAKREGKAKPKYVPDSIWKLSLRKLKEFMTKEDKKGLSVKEAARMMKKHLRRKNAG